ncbi:MAG: hypothetical protein CMB31_00665 [Euryarchaeota archaeon]|nr:hypothetical protein [Euryarchaeota archaeon]|tara:strand:+ start:1671 stop:2042 length:372 start_codon:yes stop_codon:yes gene_type:complete
METPARTVERLVWMVAIVSAFGGGNLLLNLPECEVGSVCSYQEMFDWKLGMGMLVVSLLSIILGVQAIIGRNKNQKIWISIFVDNRTMYEVIEDATNEDDVSTVSDGWAKLEEKHLTDRLEEE